MTLSYVEGDATAPTGSGAKVIVHVCNDVGGWGKGFVLAVSRRWKAPEEAYRRWHAEGGPLPFELGQVQFVAGGSWDEIARLVTDQLVDRGVAVTVYELPAAHSRGKPQ